MEVSSQWHFYYRLLAPSLDSGVWRNTEMEAATRIRGD